MATGKIMMIDKRTQVSSAIDITNYTSGKYTFPNDGYLRLIRNGNATFTFRISGTNNNAFDVYATNAGETLVYVKKGLSGRVMSADSADRVYYHELF